MSITKITVNVSGKEITLTLKEAEELYTELKSLFGDKTAPPPVMPIWKSPYHDSWHGITPI